MIENTNTKQFYPGPILNDTLEISEFLFNTAEQIKIKYSKLDENGVLRDVDLIYGQDYEVLKDEALTCDDGSEPPSHAHIMEMSLTASTGQITLKEHIHVVAGERLTVYRESAIIQDKNYPRTGAFPAATHEGALDYLTMQNQEQKDEIDRTLKVPISTQNFEGSLPLPIPSRALKINNAGTGFEMSEFDPDLALITTEEFKNQAQQAALSAEADATLASEKANRAVQEANRAVQEANRAVQEAEKATSQANLTQQYKQDTIDYVEKASNIIDTSVTEGLDKIFSTLQGQTMPIGYQYSLNCAADYIPSGSLTRDGAEYSSKQFQGLWDNYLTSNETEFVPSDVKEVEIDKGIYAITYGNGKYVGVGNTGHGIYSENLIDWTSIDIEAVNGSSMRAIAYGNGKFVAGVDREGLIYSTDGLTWYVGKEKSTDTLIKDARMSNILYLDNYFVAFSSIGGVFYSQDGITWSERIDANSSISDAIYVNNKLIVVGNKIQISTDGVNFEEIPESNNWNTTDITYGNGYFVIAGTIKETGNYFIKTSKDGINWETFSNEKKVVELSYGADRFIAMAIHRPPEVTSIRFDILESIDGVNWKERNSTDSSIVFIEFLNDTLIYTTVEKIFYQSFVRKEKTRLNTCTYSDYQREIDTYGFCNKFAVKHTFNISTTNDNLNINTNDFTVPITLESRNKEYENVVWSNLWGKCLTKNDDNTFKLNVTSGDFSGLGDRDIYLFDIKALGTTHINLYDINLSVDISSSDDGFTMHISNGPTIKGTYPVYLHLEAVSLSGGSSSLSTRYFYIQDANGNTIYTHTYSVAASSNYNNYYINAYKIDGFESSIYERRDEIKEQLVRVETIIYSTWYANGEETHPSLYGLQIEGTPQNGDIITVSSDGGTFKIPTAKQIDRYLIAKKAATEADMSWYNLYSDGWVEQGGTVVSGAVASYLVTYPIEMKDLSYTALIAPFIGASDDTGADDNVYAILSGLETGSHPYAKSTTQLRISTLSKASAGFNWLVEGYANLEQYFIPRQFIVVANGSINQSQMDWSEWASSLNGKANKSLNNLDEKGQKVIDGQWVQNIVNLGTQTAKGTYLCDISTVLPNDGYDYEVMLNLRAYNSNSSNSGDIYVYSDLFTKLGTDAYTSQGTCGGSGRQASNTFILPVGTGRTITYEIVSYAVSSLSLNIWGYRRIGTNQ